jgi:hypothetical protein
VHREYEVGQGGVVDDVGMAEVEIGSEPHRHDINIGIRVVRVPARFLCCDDERDARRAMTEMSNRTAARVSLDVVDELVTAAQSDRLNP